MFSAIYDYDGNEKTPLYSKNDNEKTVLKLIVGFCMVFCIGLLIILLISIHYGSHQVCNFKFNCVQKIKVNTFLS